MKPPDEKTGSGDVTPDARDRNDPERTNLPWLRTWRSVYLFVFGCFVLYVVLLTLFTRALS